MATKTDRFWDGLHVPAVGAIEARRADPSHPFDFYFGLNFNQEKLLIVVLSGLGEVAPDLPRLKGIRVQWIAESKSVQLALGKGHDLEMFGLLCSDLLAFTSQAGSQSECIERLCIRLVKWQRLLSKGGPRLMAEHEIRGLFAELWFLQRELHPRLGPSSIAAWKGPSGFPQDFAADGKVFEIKSHLVSAPQAVRIASPAQLWVEGAPLYLCMYHLTPLASGGRSLVDLVNEITASLAGHAAAAEDFEEKLSSLRYIDLPEYRAANFAVIKHEAFLVSDGFPRITPAMCPAGVVDLSYAIQFAALSPFAATISWSS